jgi:hypothetical protein
MGECVRCGRTTNLEYDESDTGVRGYLCGQCRGYDTDNQYIDEQIHHDKEVYRDWKKSQR